MTSPNSLAGVLTDLRAVRRELFAVHVQWHRMSTVVELSTDGALLAEELLEDFDQLSVSVLDLNGTARESADRLEKFRDRVTTRNADVLDELQHGADYYLLPDGLEALGAGRLQRLFVSVSRACLPRGRALACVPEEDAMVIVMAAERAGLEVTRMGTESGVKLIEFGTGLLRALPGE